MVFLAGLFLSIGMALAQTQVTGTVTAAEDGAPIIGASIKVVGTKTGTVTDINGNFKMDVPANAKLEVSYIGMTTKTIKAGKNLNIVLGADERSLEEIVISVPYGTRKKLPLQVLQVLLVERRFPLHRLVVYPRLCRVPWLVFSHSLPAVSRVRMPVSISVV